jgi:hypothetical protein
VNLEPVNRPHTLSPQQLNPSTSQPSGHDRHRQIIAIAADRTAKTNSLKRSQQREQSC